MTYEEKKKVIDAAKVLKEHCIGQGDCNGCVFYVEGNELACPFYNNNAINFKIPPLVDVTPEDIDLARQLQRLGVTHISRGYEYTFWHDKKRRIFGLLPDSSFQGMEISTDAVPIDIILGEDR